ncbi:MAG: ArsA family ATPase [Solirubrobacteraceae bacterium]
MPDGKSGTRGGGPRIYVCAGPGGVGKTTVSAAVALALAQRGERVAVVTIDPARRLATALGLEELGGEPHMLDTDLLAGDGAQSGGVPGGAAQSGGELWAMTLDVKRTLDRLIERLAPDERSYEEILGNRIYRNLSSAVAGSHEFSAVVKLYELHDEGGFDAIVLDTPPARNALDFLDAPTRLERFLGGRALGMFLAPGGLAARLIGKPTFLVFNIFAKIAGVDLLSELTGFFRSLAGTVDGLRERAKAVDAMLRDASTTSFLIVTSPEVEPAAEAALLHAHLAAESMPLGALIVNRVHEHGLDGHDEHEVVALLAPALGDRLAERVAANLTDFDVLAQRDAETIDALARALGDPQPTVIPQLDVEVQDLETLALVASHLDVNALSGAWVTRAGRAKVRRQQ